VAALDPWRICRFGNAAVTNSIHIYLDTHSTVVIVVGDER